jgi:hypothetical protein
MLDSIVATHSAEVEMWLDCGQHGKAVLRKITPNSVILWDSFDAPPCHADLIVRVDGKLMSRRVDVVSGLSKHAQIATVLPIDDIAPF